MIRGKTLLQVLGIYAAASWVVLQVVDLLRENMGLPDWVFSFALVLLLIGLPILLATAVVQSRLAARAAAGPAEVAALPAPPLEAAGRLFTWRNSILGGVLAFSLLFGFAGLYVLIKERALVPDEAVAEMTAPAIAILPFTVRGEGLEVWSEGMVDVLATALDGVAGMRTISGRTAKAQWDEATAGGALADRETALEVATGVGARYAVYGTAIASGAGMRIAADLYDVRTGDVMGHSQVEGPVDSIFPLVDRISLDVLRMVGSGEGDELPGVDLAGATTTSVEALRAYLEGEAEFRRGAFGRAIEHYTRAVEADSTFAMAFGRLGQAYGWSSGGSRVGEMRDRAAKYADRLPDRERLLATTNQSVLDREVLAELRALVRARPDEAEAWYLLGEIYFHEGSDIPVSVDETERAFERAAELDPGFMPYRIHLVDLAMWMGRDSSHVAARLRDLERLSTEPQEASLLIPLVFGSDSAQRAALAVIDTLPLRQFDGLINGLKHPRYWPVRERYLEVGLANAERYVQPGRTSEGMRNRFLNPLTWEPMVNAGQFRKGLARAEEWRQGASCYVYQAHFLGFALSEEMLAEHLSGDAPCAAMYQAERGEGRALEEQLTELGVVVDSLLAEGDTTSAEATERFGDFLRGLARLHAGEPEAALPLMEGGLEMGSIFQTSVARLYMELDRPEDAIPYLDSFGPANTMGIADYWLGQAYEQVGEPEKAVSAYATFLEGWKDVDPEAEHIVDDASARLQAIVRERG